MSETTEDPETHPEEIVIDLREPISKGVTTPVSQLRLRAPKSGEIERAQDSAKGNSTRMMMMLMFYQTQVPLVTLRELDVRDLNKASNFLGSFVDP